MDGNLLTPLRALGVTFVALVTIYRLWVLFVSLPQHRAPPQHWLLPLGNERYVGERETERTAFSAELKCALLGELV